MMEGEGQAQSFQSFPGPEEVVVVEVNADQPAGRSQALQQFDGMARPADRGIDKDRARPGSQEGQHLIEQDRSMLSGRCAAGSAFHGKGVRQSSAAASGQYRAL